MTVCSDLPVDLLPIEEVVQADLVVVVAQTYAEVRRLLVDIALAT